VFGESASVAPNEVAAGDAAAGMAIDQYAEIAIQNAGDPELGFVLPPGLTVISPDAIAAIRDASEPELARDFVLFTLSVEGQRLLFQPPGKNGQTYSLRRMPVRRDLYADPDAPAGNPYEFDSGFRYDSKWGSRRWAVVNDLFQAWHLDTHAELAAAWKAVIDRGLRPDEVAALTALPFDFGDVDEDELNRLVDEKLDELAKRWSAPDAGAFRLETRRAWALAALDRYRRIAAGDR